MHVSIQIYTHQYTNLHIIKSVALGFVQTNYTYKFELLLEGAKGPSGGGTGRGRSFCIVYTKMVRSGA